MVEGTVHMKAVLSFEPFPGFPIDPSCRRQHTHHRTKITMKLVLLPTLLVGFASLTTAAPTASTTITLDKPTITALQASTTVPTTTTSTRTTPSIQPYIPESSAVCKDHICCVKDGGRCWRESPTGPPEKPPVERL